MTTVGSPPTKKEPELNFYEDMDIPAARQNTFTNVNENEEDKNNDELSDADINKLLIVTQASTRNRKHEG